MKIKDLRTFFVLTLFLSIFVNNLVHTQDTTENEIVTDEDTTSVDGSTDITNSEEENRVSEVTDGGDGEQSTEQAGDGGDEASAEPGTATNEEETTGGDGAEETTSSFDATTEEGTSEYGFTPENTNDDHAASDGTTEVLVENSEASNLNQETGTPENGESTQNGGETTQNELTEQPTENGETTEPDNADESTDHQSTSGGGDSSTDSNGETESTNGGETEPETGTDHTGGSETESKTEPADTDAPGTSEGGLETDGVSETDGQNTDADTSTGSNTSEESGGGDASHSSTENGDESDNETSVPPSDGTDGVDKDDETTIVQPVTDEMTTEEGEENSGDASEVSISESENTSSTSSPIEPSPTTAETSNELSLYINPDQETITVRPGETLDFTCTARGPFSNLQVLIYKEQTPVDQSDSGSVQIRKENAQSSDAGQYICYGFPPDRSTYVVKSINVVVEGSGGGYRPDRPTDGKRVDAKVDTNVVLECAYSGENTNTRWKRLDGKMSDYVQEYYGKLYIYYLKLEDSGEYECQAEDGRTEKVSLRVYSGDQPEPEPEPQPEPQPERPDTHKYAIRASLSDNVIKFQPGQTIEQECNALTNGYTMEIEWYNPRKQLIRNDGKHTISTETRSDAPLNKVSKLIINNADNGDSGYYECRVVVENQRESVKFELSPESSSIICAIEEATCRNGQCIPRSGLCDGRMDCSDGSDEINCGGSNQGRCEPNEKQCRNQKCIQKIWWCDGENDCGDNSDEDQCPHYNADPRPGEICKTHEFLCKNGNQCVLKGFVCDGEYDCLDQSDEIGCEKPSIIRGPIRNMTVYLGRTIRIECEAGGFPSPYINWRLNWGHVCEEPRCVSSTENGKGILTINDAKLEDAGAYSCEALNSKGRVFAIPDAIVYVLVAPGEWATVPTDRPIYPTPRPTPQTQPSSRYCDPNGSYNSYPPCQCKPNRVGSYCEQCVERHFSLSVENKNSYCASCFCNGLEVFCEAGSLYYNKIESKFIDNDDGWSVNNKYSNLSTLLNVRENGIEFVDFQEFPDQELFLYAPSKYLGNKLASYGGNLTFNIRYEGPSGPRPKRLEVRIAGSRLNLVHRVSRVLYPYYDNQVTITLVQDDFRRYGDNARVDREHMLMALSNIEMIMIRASFIPRQYSVFLKDVSLDHAEPYAKSQSSKRSQAVESCRCPVGYTGTSCESCAPGYRRSHSGSYLGHCEKTNDVTLVIEVPNNRIELRPGENHVVKVNIIGSRNPVRWVKDPEGYLPYGVQQSGNNLEIRDAKPEYDGRYICTLYTPQGEVRETLIIVVSGGPTQNAPPTVHSLNSETIEVDIGQPFSLECYAKGNPTPSIRIIAPQSRDSGESPEAIMSGEVQPEAKFELSYFTENNAGTYMCVAENVFGRDIKQFYVTVRRAPQRGPPTITLEQKQVEAVEGSSVIINFNYNGTEPVNIKVRQYSEQPTNAIVNVDKARKTIEIKQIDKDSQGPYIVEATNDYGSEQAYFQLVVQSAPGPKIMVTETVIRTDAGTTLKIEPKVQYSGRPQFTWTKDGRPLPSNVEILHHVLYVPYVTKENQGVYTLTLVDDYGTAKIQVTIIVDERSPNLGSSTPLNANRIIVKHDTDVELEVGQSANLICNLHTRNYNPRVITTTSWIKGNREQRERFPSNIRPNQERLQIIKIKPSDAGLYTCITISSDSVTQTALVNIKVKDGARPSPPSARLDQREKHVNIGDSFDLTCTVSGSPQPSIVWLFNNQPIEYLSNAYVQNNQLTIRNAQYDLNGYITCRAVGADGNFGEDSTLVRVKQSEGGDSGEVDPAGLRVEVNPPSQNVAAGETAALQCNVYDAQGNAISPSELELTWIKESGFLPADADPSNYQLILYNVKAADSGSYTCQVNHKQTGQIGRGSSKIIVGSTSSGEQEPSSGERTPLKVEVTPKEANLVQGRDGELVCNVQGGAGNPQISWKRLSDSLDPARHIQQGNKLIIKDAQANDRGYFECEVESAGESARDYSRVEVEAREKPQIELYPNDDSVELDFGGTTYVQCRVTAGIPNPTIEWRRTDGAPLSSKVSVIQDGSLLQITDAGQAEFGQYECVAKNNEGEASARINVKSRGGPQPQPQPQPPQPEPDYNNNGNSNEAGSEEKPEPEGMPDVIIPNNQVDAREGDSITLNCQTSSGQPYRIDWTGPNGDYLGGNTDGSLVISSVKASDAGAYTCTVTNRFGNSQAQAVVTLNGGQPRLKVEVKPKSRSVLPGGNAEFTCEISGASSEPIIRWSRAGQSQLPQYHQAVGNTLQIYNIREEDAGRYQCTAQGADGSIEFDAAYLQVSRVDKSSPFPVYIRVLEAPTDSYDSAPSFRYGVKVTVECVAQASDVEQISWSKSEGVSRATYDRNDNTNTMVIPALLSMDLGNYVCIAHRRNGEKAQNSISFNRHPEHGNLFTYEVQGPSSSSENSHTGDQDHGSNDHDSYVPPHHYPGQEPETNEPPKIIILGSKEVTVNQGGSAEIRCEATGISEVEFSKHGETLPENNRIEKSGNVHSLKLSNLKENDRGYYICNGQNANGASRDYVYLHVQANGNDQNERAGDSGERDDRRNDAEREPERPDTNRRDKKPLVYLKTLTNGAPITVGQELRIICQVDDFESQVLFSKTDGAQSERTRIEEVLNGHGKTMELIISPFENEDAGKYKCYARNRFGESEDTAHIELEADNSFTFKTDKNADLEVSPGSPHISLKSDRTPQTGEASQIICSLEEDNGIPANHYSWLKYPSLPRSSQADQNRLIINRFEQEDNGLYTCRASTDERDYEKTKLIATNDYLLSRNPYFSFTQVDQDTVEVKCRPESDGSTFTWRANDQNDGSFNIEGDRLLLYRSSASNHFSCILNIDSELGPIALDLDVNQDLLNRALSGSQQGTSGESGANSNEDHDNDVKVDVNGQHNDGGDGVNSYYECQPGENC